MNFFGARNQTQQYIPKKGVARPDWSYRPARRNAARIMHWPARYRWRVWLKAMIKEAMEKMRLIPGSPDMEAFIAKQQGTTP